MSAVTIGLVRVDIARAATSWSCGECRNSGTVHHDASTSMLALVQSIAHSHSVVSPDCHKARGLKGVRLTIGQGK